MSRRRAVRRAGLVVLAGNVGLFALKAIAWWLSGSFAVGSEAINSLADSAYSLVVVGGLYLTTQPPDIKHPHGHERIEPFVSLLIAAAILAVASALLYGAVQAVLGPTPAPPTGPTALFALGTTLVIKYGLYWYAMRVGEAHGSPAVKASAVDNRNDILTAGAALVGVAGAQAGIPILDPVAGGVVALFVGYTGVEVGRRNLDYLVGAAPPEQLREEILTQVRSHPEVQGVHDVVAHYVGPEVDVSLHVEVAGEMSLRDAHEIETQIVQAIEALDVVDDAFVHVDPREEWKESAEPPPTHGETDRSG